MKKAATGQVQDENSDNDDREISAITEYHRGNRITPELLEKLGQGDHKAFNMVYMAFTDPMVEFLRSILRDEEDAKEITQEVFTNLWVRRETVNADTKIKSYLYTAARNRAFNMLRNRNVKFKYFSEELASPGESLDVSGDEILQSKETRLLIEAVVAAMPEQRKKVFVMSRKEGLSHEQIADRLGISSGTVAQHIKLALKTIRETLALYLIWFL